MDINEKLKRAGAVKINGIDYAVGLMWEPADDPDRAMKEAYSVARSETVNADFLCLRFSAPTQYALGWKSVGHSSGQIPLAAAVTENVGANYIGCFQVDGRWWLGISKNNLILPYGDSFYASQDEAKQAMLNAISENNSDDIVKFAPTSWEIPGSRDTKLEILLTNIPKIKLSSTESLVSRYKNVVLFALLLLIVGNYGLKYFNSKVKVSSELKAKRKQELEIERKKPRDGWKKLPSSAAFIDNCLNGVYSIPLDISGWSLSDATCDGSNLTAAWVKNGGYIYDMQNKSQEYGFDLVLDTEGQNAVTRKILSKLELRSDPVEGEGLWTASQISQKMYDLESSIGVTVQLSGLSSKPSQPRILKDENGNEVELPPIYSFAGFEFSTSFPIDVWKDFLMSIPGSSITSLKWSLEGNGQWDVKGRIYQK